MLDIRRMQLLRDLGRLGTIAAVAQAQFCTPSAVSQQLSALEREAGLPLIQRCGRGVELTAAGLALAERAGPVLALLEEAEAALATIRGELTGQLRVGAFPTAVRSVLPAALVRLGSEHPRLELHLTELDPAAVPDALRSGALDIALVHEYDYVPDESDPALATEPLLEETIFLAAADAAAADAAGTGACAADTSAAGARCVGGAGAADAAGAMGAGGAGAADAARVGAVGADTGAAGARRVGGAGAADAAGAMGAGGADTGAAGARRVGGAGGAVGAGAGVAGAADAAGAGAAGVVGAGVAGAAGAGAVDAGLAARRPPDARTVGSGGGHDPVRASRDLPWIVASPGTLCHLMTVRLCQAAGFTPRIRHYVDDFAAVLTLVAAGQGVALVPELALADRPAGVALSPLPACRRTLIAYRRGAAAHPAVAACTAALRAATADYLARG